MVAVSVKLPVSEELVDVFYYTYVLYRNNCRQVGVNQALSTTMVMTATWDASRSALGVQNLVRARVTIAMGLARDTPEPPSSRCPCRSNW